MSEPIAVDFGELEGAGQQILSMAKQLDTVLSDLRENTRRAVESYDGQSSDRFFQATRDWDTSATDAQTILNDLGQAVVETANDYMLTERTNSGYWG